MSRGHPQDGFQVIEWDEVSCSSEGATQNHLEHGDLAEELRVYEANQAASSHEMGIQVDIPGGDGNAVVQVSDDDGASEALEELEGAIFRGEGPPLALRGCPDLTRKLEGIPLNQCFLRRDGPQRFCGYMEKGRVLHYPGCHQLKRGLAFKRAACCPACTYMHGAGDKMYLDRDNQIHYDLDCQFIAKVWRARGYKMLLEVECRMLCRSCYSPIVDAE